MRCPITKVKIIPFFLTAIVGFGFVFGFDYLLHHVLLMEEYEKTSTLWRAPEEMKLELMFAGQFLTVVTALLIYTRNIEGKCLGEGLRFGLLIGLFMGVLSASAYAWMPITETIALYWFGGNIVLGLGLGIIFKLLYRDMGCSSCKKSSSCSTDKGDCSKKDDEKCCDSKDKCCDKNDECCDKKEKCCKKDDKEEASS